MAEPCPTCGRPPAPTAAFVLVGGVVGFVIGMLVANVVSVARTQNAPVVAYIPKTVTPTPTGSATETPPPPTATGRTPTPTRSATPRPTVTPKPTATPKALTVDRVTDRGSRYTSVILTYRNLTDTTLEQARIECTALDKSNAIVGTTDKLFWDAIDGPIYPGFKRTEEVLIRTVGADVGSASCRIVFTK